MLCRWLITVLTLVLPPAVFGEDFGEGAWGDSPEQIRSAEQRPNLTPVAARDYLIFAASLPGIHQTRLVYQFEDNALVGGRFLFEADPGASADAWIEQFEQVRDLIARQYGAPSQRLVLKPQSGSEVPREQWAGELAADRLILKTEWALERTRLVQQLAWKQRAPHHQVIYRPVSAAADAVQSEPEEPMF